MSDDTMGVVAPAKAVRLLDMLTALVGEVDLVAADEGCRDRLITAHRASLIEVASTVSDLLVHEMVRLHMWPLEPDASMAQVKVAQAQLLGWFTGLLQAGGLVTGRPLATEGPPPQTLLDENERG